MKMFRSYILASIALAGVISALPAQATAQQNGANSHPLSAAVERSGGKTYLRLTNTDAERGFRGSAQIRFDGSASSTETPRLSLELAPGETRLFPIVSASSSEQYMLTIYNQDGAIVLFQAAPISQASKTPVPSRPTQPVSTNDEVSLQPRLLRASQNTEFEIPVTGEPDPFILAFEIVAPAPLNNASLLLSAKDFQQRQTITVQRQAHVEFKLPEELSERNFQYVLTDASGKVRAKGEIDLDQIVAAESVSVSSLTFDRPTYGPGDSARLVIELQGQTSRSYRLEVTTKEGDTLLYKDMRKGVGQSGKARQEFTFDLPREVKGPITFEYKVFSAQTGALFDSGLRQIALSDTVQKNDAGDRPKVSP